MCYFIEVFNHRVDAAVFRAIGEQALAEDSLAKADEVIHSLAFAMGYCTTLDWDEFSDEQFDIFIAGYPEYKLVAQDGFAAGKQYWKLERDAEQQEKEEQEAWKGECNDDSDWCGSESAVVVK
jgi:hypothetical protein